MRNVLPPRRFAPLFIALAAAWAIIPARVATADEPRPGQEGPSPKATRPSQATLTAKVSPAEAKPGDTVTLTVTAEVSRRLAHLRLQQDPARRGPARHPVRPVRPRRPDSQGRMDGPAAADREEGAGVPGPAEFVSFHEGEVTWSIALAVPADAKPGKKAIRVQAGYQVCSDQNCSFPGQWTLPAVELTILSASRRPPPAKPAQDAQGLQVDRRGRRQAAQGPREEGQQRAAQPGATLTASVEPKEARSGRVGDPPRSRRSSSQRSGTYLPVNTTTPGGPARPGSTSLTPTGWASWAAGLGLAEAGEGHKPDPANKVAPPFAFYEDEVTWKIKLGFPPCTEPAKKAIPAQDGYHNCNDQTCMVPGQWTLPAVELTVLEGSTIAPAGSSTCDNPNYKAAMAALNAANETPPPADTGKSDVERESEKGLIPFLLTCALGGLVALAMPCVWPMVPITVKFFVKQGQQKKGSTTGLAVTYCLAIIGVFTAVGLLFSISFGAASLSKLANNPWVNLFVAGLFLVFGLSLLGLFEIGLPSSWLNASAQGEGRGGLVGVVFMALTLTITSFTCTFPVVGGLLVMAANGSYLYPVIGMATFAAVVALPFFLLPLLAGAAVEGPQERRLDERGQGRRRAGGDRRRLQVPQHGRDRLGRPEEARSSTPSPSWRSGWCCPWSAGSTCSASSGRTTTTTPSRSARAG